MALPTKAKSATPLKHGVRVRQKCSSLTCTLKTRYRDSSIGNLVHLKPEIGHSFYSIPTGPTGLILSSNSVFCLIQFCHSLIIILWRQPRHFTPPRAPVELLCRRCPQLITKLCPVSVKWLSGRPLHPTRSLQRAQFMHAMARHHFHPVLP